MTVKISKYFMKNSFLTPKLVLEKICPNLANKNGLKSQKNFKQTVRYGTDFYTKSLDNYLTII